MKNLVSIFAGHDANVSFYNAKTDEYYTIEVESLVKKRYFRLHEDNNPEYQKEILTLCREIAEEDWGIEKAKQLALFLFRHSYFYNRQYFFPNLLLKIVLLLIISSLYISWQQGGLHL